MRKGTSLTGVFIGLLLLILIGVAVVVPVVNDLVTTATELTSVTNENITFLLNNTAYDLDNTPVDESDNDVTLYYFPNTSFALPDAHYLYASDQVRVYANGTGGYPNTTNGSSTFYYGYYDYQGEGYVTSSTSRLVLGFFVILLVVVIVVAVVSMTGIKK